MALSVKGYIDDFFFYTNMNFEKWFIVKDENKINSLSSQHIINVATNMGKAQLCRLVRRDGEGREEGKEKEKEEEEEEEEEEGKKQEGKKRSMFLNFIIPSRYADISVRDIILAGKSKNNDPENEDNVKLLRTFLLTYEGSELF